MRSKDRDAPESIAKLIGIVVNMSVETVRLVTGLPPEYTSLAGRP